MRRTGMWLAMLAAIGISGIVSAVDIEVDGQWNDWFTYDGTWDENWSQSAASGSRVSSEIRYFNDSDYDAAGGQDYDIEQIFYYYKDLTPDELSGGILYIGLVTGYKPSNYYKAGDMFIDLGCDDSFDLAVGTAKGDRRYGDTWGNDGWTTKHVKFYDHRAADPYRVDTRKSGDTYVGQSEVDWDYYVGHGYEHNFLEMAVELSGEQELEIAEGGIGLHWTMSCGNDYIDVCDKDPLSTIPPPTPPTPSDPVPEPATVALLGMGVLGLALRRRRPIV